MIDEVLINRKISLISKDLKALKPLSRLTLRAYLGHPQYEVLVERYLERIITRMIDINYHLIIETDNSPPSDYFISFVELSELKVFPRSFAEKIAQAAGLRNRLVHEYNSIDEKKVYQAMKEAMKDIPKYLRYIKRFLEK